MVDKIFAPQLKTQYLSNGFLIDQGQRGGQENVLMQRIEQYSFGKIVIDGKQYKSDVIIYPDRIDDKWWRADGHNLIISDLPFLPKHPPNILVIGQGKYGLMKISQDFQNLIKENKLDCRFAKTDEAVEIYNNLWNTGAKDMVAALHLTC